MARAVRFKQRAAKTCDYSRRTTVSLRMVIIVSIASDGDCFRFSEISSYRKYLSA
jgi:hypothetical protein